MSRGAERMPCWVNFGNLQPFRAETRRKLHKYAKETDAAASVSYFFIMNRQFRRYSLGSCPNCSLTAAVNLLWLS